MKLVVFDGATGSGKTTALNAVRDRLSSLNRDVSVISERNRVRNLIDALDAGNLIRSQLPPLTESLFWTMNQVFRYEVDLQKRQNDLVFMDRYIFTPIVYQYIALKDRGVTLDGVIDYVSKPFGISLPIPEVSVILLAPLEILQTRFKLREGRDMNPLEVEITKNASVVYRQLQTRFHNYHIVESTKPIAEICEEVSSIILQNT